MMAQAITILVAHGLYCYGGLCCLQVRMTDPVLAADGVHLTSGGPSNDGSSDSNLGCSWPVLLWWPVLFAGPHDRPRACGGWVHLRAGGHPMMAQAIPILVAHGRYCYGGLCCLQVRMTDPVLAADGFTYERGAIQEWLKPKPGFPCHRSPVGAHFPDPQQWAAPPTPAALILLLPFPLLLLAKHAGACLCTKPFL